MVAILHDTATAPQAPHAEPATGRQALAGFAGLTAAAAVTLALWYVFMHPNGVLALYTPMYGFSLAVGLLAAVVFMTKVAEGAPFAGRGWSRPLCGLVMTAVAVAAVYLVVHGVFWNLLGRFGVTYFSPHAIIAEGGVGAEFFNARENASTAIIYFMTAFLWLAMAWSLGFGRWPWHRDTVSVRATSKAAMLLLLSGLVFLVLFHPHVTHLFYPAQSMAGVTPWWREFSLTSSAFFNLGLVLSAVMAIVVSELLWEGEPWRRLDRQGQPTLAKGAAVLVGTAFLGMAFAYGCWALMNLAWYEPFVGGQRLDGPHFRYLHIGEVAGFIVLAAFIQKTYLGNLTNRGSLAVRAAARTGLAVVLAALLWLFYYSPLATMALGKVPGIAAPDDTSLVFTVLFLAVVLIHAEFFGRWPLPPRRGA